MEHIVIELPDWARIGATVEVKDVRCDRGDGPNRWFKEKIISFGYDGVFTQAHNCPVYYFRFDDWGKKIRFPEDNTIVY